MTPRPSLEQLQRWMQAVITSPGGVAAGAASLQARAEIETPAQELERIIPRSRRLTSEERLSIYQQAYFARLLDCLRDMFPMTVRLLGEAAFDDLALAYVQHFPSRSYTLNRLADRFAEFLSLTRPPDDAADLADVVMELVRLEIEISEVFDGPGCENAPLTDRSSISAIPSDQRGALRLRTAPCLRLLKFGYPINDCYSALRAGRQPDWPAPAESYLALSRRAFIVQRHRLTRAEFLTLQALQRGDTIAESLAWGVEAIEDGPIDQPTEEQIVHAWFQDWVQAGFFDLRNP